MAGVKSMALERKMYRDPLEVLIALENRTCAGCMMVRELLGVKYCGVDKRYGQRCKSFIGADDGKR